MRINCSDLAGRWERNNGPARPDAADPAGGEAARRRDPRGRTAARRCPARPDRLSSSAEPVSVRAVPRALGWPAAHPAGRSPVHVAEHPPPGRPLRGRPVPGPFDPGLRPGQGLRPAEAAAAAGQAREADEPMKPQSFLIWMIQASGRSGW
jgi:hypothetical protein